MLTKERAQYLWDRRLLQCELPYAFRQKCNMPDSPIYADGMTEAEWNHVRQVWDTLPGNSCFMSAFWKIMKGE